MKKLIQKLSLLFLITAVMVNCTNKEISYIDPMITGICNNADKAIEGINSKTWNVSLTEFRDQRLKLINIKNLIENDGYTGSDYALADPELSEARVDESLLVLEIMMDSVWSANIQTAFNGVKKNSAGIQNFGLKTYNNTTTSVADAYAWLMSDDVDPEVTDLIANDFLDLQVKIDVLAGLSALNDAEVTEFVNQIKAQYAEMKQQYAALATDIASSSYFSKAQKALYSSLQQPLADMETTISENLSLAAKAKLDAIDQQLYSLVYFVANNYTSPALKPVVFGEISSISELRWFSEVATNEDRTGDWALTVDIDAAETHRWNPDANGPGFQQIPEFTGTFDGQNHIIHGLFMTKWAAVANNQAGFFFVVNGNIKNLGLVNVQIVNKISTGDQGGVLVGWIKNGTVTNCFTHGMREPLSQAGGFIGRTAGTVVVENCFSAVTFKLTELSSWANSGSFMGLPVGGPLTIKNCYTTGFNSNQAIFGHGSAINLVEASGIYFDSSTVGTTSLDRGAGAYSAASAVKMTDPGVVTDVATAKWGDLANFPGLSANVWEIKTVPQIDSNPRPYLKGFNYDVIKDFIIP